MDKTGPVVLVVFGALAVEFSREANDVQIRSSRGEKVSRIVEVDNARIVGFQKK